MRVRARADFRKRTTDGRWHPGLTPREEYFVIEIGKGYYRVVDDNGEPIIYPKPLFEVIDPAIPADWEMHEYPDGQYFLRPARAGGRGFYEDFFGSDGDRVAQAHAQQAVREALDAAMRTGSEDDRRVIQRDLDRLIGQ